MADACGWKMAFVAASAGPLLAAAIIVLALEASVPRAAARPALLGFRPVLRNRHVRPYLLTTAAHSWELHGTRSWLVAFLTFAAGAGGGTQDVPVSVALATALIFLLGPLASVSGNELALRYGRTRVLTYGPVLSAAASCIIGFLGASPWLGLLAFAAIHMYFVGIDAGTMTAGVVSTADPAHRGATLALYSMVGFSTGFVSPTLFGVVLDLAGGRGELVAWGLAFASLGLVSILGAIPARRLLVAEYSTQTRGESGGERGTQGGEPARDRSQGS